MFNFATLVFTVLLGYALSQNTLSETTCQTHKRNAGGSRALMQWDIQCDERGKYKALQCTVQTPKWCACYNEEEMVTSPTKSTTSCQCHLKKDSAIKNGASQCEIPECQRNGQFQKKQCCSLTGKCHCVDAITGDRKTQPTDSRNLRCP